MGSGSIVRWQTLYLSVGLVTPRQTPGLGDFGKAPMHSQLNGNHQATEDGTPIGFGGKDVEVSAEQLRHGQTIAQSRPDLLRVVSEAQRRVLELLLVGLTEPQIAEQIGRSRHTVHDHTKALYAILGVSSRVQLVLLFSRPPGEKPAAVKETSTK